MRDGTVPEYPPGWARMTREEKRAWRFDVWRERTRVLAPSDRETAARCMARLERLIAVYNVTEPDRVPVSGAAGMLPFAMAGFDYHTSIYDPERAADAIWAFNRSYAEELDSPASFGFTGLAARPLDLLDVKMYAYPGHGMSTDAPNFQFVEGEYMVEGEYDDLLRDPSDFWLRTYLPRAFAVFEPLAQVSPVTDIVEINSMQLWALARPEVQTMLQRLLDAGKELSRYMQAMKTEAERAAACGFPPGPRSNFAKAPFDTLGDTLRGTKQIIMDMYRQPDKLLQALDVVAELTIDSILHSPGVANSVGVFFPLHKGADGWMSEEQFVTFYWPTLRRVINAFVDEGLLVGLFAEGGYDTRLHLVDEFPRGAVTWEFDRTDMAKAKRMLGDTCAIRGNVASSLLVAGSSDEVERECRRLIEICAPGGGYILGPGAVPEFPKLENLRAMARVARAHGAYS